MKICILTERMRIGFGVDLVVDEQARRLAAAGHDVVVLVLHADLVQPPRSYRLVVLRRIMQVGDLRTPEGMRAALGKADVGPVDVWLIHTPPFYDWAQWLDGPVVITEYGAPPGRFFAPETGNHIDGMVEHRFDEIYGRLQPFDAIVSISHALDRWLPERARTLSTMIHLGGDHLPTAVRSEAEDLRASLAIGPDECLILWVGRMQLAKDEQPYKGFPELLNLIPLVRKQVPRARFVLAGRIGETDRRRLTCDGLTVLANLDAGELARAFAAADILVNLSRWEGFNLALLEAEFQGTPVVAYDLEPHREIVRDGETGLLARTPKDLFEKLVALATEPDRRRGLAADAAGFARGFTWDRNVAELTAVAEGCVARAPSRTDIAVLRDLAAAKPVPKRRTPDAGATSDAGSSWRAIARRGAAQVSALIGLSEALPRSPWGVLADPVFVRHAFRTLLGRDPTPDEFDEHLARLREGEPRPTLLASIRFGHGDAMPVTDPDLQRLIDAGEADARTRPASRAAGRDRSRPEVPGRPRQEGSGKESTGPESGDAPASAWGWPVRTGDGRADRVGDIGPDHVLMVAPGAVPSGSAIERLTWLARPAGPDLIFGDERVRSASGSRLRILGPFSHGRFLEEPDLGGVVAVHRSLLSCLGLSPTTILTAPVLLDLVASAHSVTYVPAEIGERPGSEVAANRPTEAEMKAHLGRLGRPATLVGGQSDRRRTFDVRFPARRPWKAAIVVVRDRAATDRSRAASAETLPPGGDHHVCFVETGSSSGAGVGDAAGARRDTNHRDPPSPSYGRMVNEAVRRAPDDCDLVVVIDEGVTPVAPDWLDRLAETALQPRTGVVAPATYYADSRVRHVGMMLGRGELCGYVSRFVRLGERPSDLEIDARAGLRECSVVSRHCLVVRRDLFSEQGGFDETLERDAVDIDLCLRLRLVGLSVLMDGRVAMTSSDDTPRWGRTYSSADVVTLVSRYRAQLSEPDPFWIPGRTGDDATLEGSRKTHLPPMRAR